MGRTCLLFEGVGTDSCRHVDGADGAGLIVWALGGDGQNTKPGSFID